MRNVIKNPLDAVRGIGAGVQERVGGSVRGLFSAVGDPLEDTMSYPGDPGLFGPESMSWEVISDVSAFVGGIRALLIQAAHPEVASGVADHSRYREDPLGRLARTSAYVTATTFGSMPEVERAVSGVARAHRGIVGVSHRGVRYSAGSPELLSWVHNSLVESFMVAYHWYRRPLTGLEADRFVAEQARLGEMLGASDLPRTRRELSEYIGTHPRMGGSPGGAEAVEFLASPPLPVLHRGPYKVLHAGAVATLHPRVREVLRVRVVPGGVLAARGCVGTLRLALGEHGPSFTQAHTRAAAGGGL
jgi:uncharacterized protein (DUF2236 family)